MQDKWWHQTNPVSLVLVRKMRSGTSLSVSLCEDVFFLMRNWFSPVKKKIWKCKIEYCHSVVFFSHPAPWLSCSKTLIHNITVEQHTKQTTANPQKFNSGYIHNNCANNLFLIVLIYFRTCSPLLLPWTAELTCSIAVMNVSPRTRSHWYLSTWVNITQVY